MLHMSGCGNFELSYRKTLTAVMRLGCVLPALLPAPPSLFFWHYELNRCKNRWNTWGPGVSFLPWPAVMRVLWTGRALLRGRLTGAIAFSLLRVGGKHWQK